jgi:hypothetical protein
MIHGIESASSSDEFLPPQDLPSEGQLAASNGHLLKWMLEHHLSHPAFETLDATAEVILHPAVTAAGDPEHPLPHAS